MENDNRGHHFSQSSLIITGSVTQTWFSSLAMRSANHIIMTNLLKPLIAKQSFVILFLIFSSFSPLFAQSPYTSVATGNWNADATWSGTGTPIAGDVVIIANGHTVTVTASAACNSLTFSGASATLSVSSSFTLAVAGAITLNNAADAVVSATVSGAGTISCASVNIGNGTAATSNNTTWTHTLISTINSLTISGNLIINSYFVSGASGRFRNGVFTHTSGTITSAGISTVNVSANNVATYTMGASSPTLNLSGAVPLSLAGTGTSTLTFNGTGATVNYNGSSQTIGAYTYTNLTLSGSGTKTITSVTTISGNLSLSGTVAAATAANLTVGGNLDVGAGTTFATGTNFTLGVTGTSSITGTLTLAGTGAKTFTGNVTINTNGVWNETGSAPYNFGGNLQHDGTTFTVNTGIHTFSGTGTTITGTNAIAIPNLTISGTATNYVALTVSTALAGAGGLTNDAAGTLNIGGPSSITSFSNSGTATVTNAGAITTSLANFTNTGILNLNGSGTITGITNSGTINLASSGTITDLINGAGGLFTISATPVPAISTLNASTIGNTINYTGGIQIIKATIYDNITLSGSGEKAMAAGTSVLGVLSIAPTGSATASIGAGLNLIVNSLLLAGANQVSGTYGSTSSAATFQNDTYFAATNGILSVNIPIVSTATGGDWKTGSTWVGGSVPTATQSAVIATTGVGEVITSTTVICAGLTVNSGAILTVNRDFTMNGTTSITGTINFGSANPTIRGMTFNASVTLNSGAIWDESDGGSNTVLHTYFFANSIINNATTFTALTGLHTFSGTGMMLSGATTTSIANVEVTGTYTNAGTLTVGTALTGGGTLINGDGTTGTLNIAGTATITGLTASVANNTIDYTGGAQTIYIPSSGVYHHLIFSGSAAKTLDVGITTINGNFTMAGTATTTGLIGLTIGGDVTLGAGTTFTAGAFTHNVGGDWINNGGTFTNTGSTINFNGTGAQSINSGGISFNNFTITNTGGTCTATTNNITVAGTFTTSAGTVLDMATFALSVTTVAHSGTLKTQNVSATPITAAKTWGGLVEYNSASNQTIINGSYNDLMISNAGVKTILTATTVNCQTITFNDAATLDILGTGLFNVLG